MKKKSSTSDCGCPLSPPKNNPEKTINLALQGGGAHGAYTWGVMDKLLEDGRFGIEGLSATSAGSMNAVSFAYGNMTGGSEGARESLHQFWKNISTAGDIFSPVKQTPWGKMINQWNMENSMSFMLFEMAIRTFSPYQLNPLNFNPLKNVLEKSIDFDTLKKCQDTKLFISATNVRTGQVKVFKTQEITLDVVLASACLPFLYQAVKIDDEHYWDGGYMGNPALFPLIYHTETKDILVIHINPIETQHLPVSSIDIMDRINEITFNSSLIKEFRAISFVTKLIEEDWLKKKHKNKLRKMRIHSIRADKYLCDLKVASKFNSDWHFLTDLRDRGREAAGAWLDKNFTHIGMKSTVDLRAEFLD